MTDQAIARHIASPALGRIGAGENAITHVMIMSNITRDERL